MKSEASPKILALIGVLSILLLGVLALAQNDYATGTTTLNATIVQFVSITPSTALSDGIRFGTVYANSNNNLALNNTGSDFPSTPENTTYYWLQVDSSTTSNIQFFHKANDLSSGADTIAITNVKNEAKTTSNGENVNMTITQSSTNSMSNAYDFIGGATKKPCNSVSAGSSCYIAYFLDVPAGKSSGDYETTYYYCGNATSGSVAC